MSTPAKPILTLPLEDTTPWTCTWYAGTSLADLGAAIPVPAAGRIEVKNSAGALVATMSTDNGGLALGGSDGTITLVRQSAAWEALVALGVASYPSMQIILTWPEGDQTLAEFVLRLT